MADNFVDNAADIDPGSGHAAGDNLYFQSGATAATTNLNKSGLAAGGHAQVAVAFGWTADIGTAASPLRAEISSGASARLLYSAGGGRMYYRPNGNTDLCDLLRNVGPGSRHLYLVTGGTVTVAELSAAKTTINGAVTATTIRVSNTANVFILDDSSTDPTTLDIGGGTVTTERGATTVEQRAGQANWDAGTNTIGTYNLDGGTCLLEESGTITTLNWKAGAFDVSQLQRPLTITTANIWKTSVDNGSLVTILNHPLVTITTTNWIMDAA